MLAKLIRQGDATKLILCSGQIKNVTNEEMRAFLYTYDSDTHYKEPNKLFVDHMDELEGESLAYVSDDKKLVFTNKDFFVSLLTETVEYLTATEYGELYGKQPSIIKRFCRAGRIKGAMLKGSQWLIPANAEYPQDIRRTSSDS